MKKNIDFKFVLMLATLCFCFFMEANSSLSCSRAQRRIQILYNTGVQYTNNVSRFFAEKKVRREASIEWYQNKIAVIEVLKNAARADLKDMAILRWHDEEVKNFNIATMRNTHGMQYKGAEVSMKSLNQ